MIFGIAPRRRRAPYWWESLMPDDLVAGLIRDVEKNASQISSHERECALRYGRIEEKQTEIKDVVEGIEAKLEALVERLSGSAWKANWKAWALAGAMFMAVVGALAWETGQLYALEPVRVTAAAQVSPR